MNLDEIEEIKSDMSLGSDMGAEARIQELRRDIRAARERKRQVLMKIINEGPTTVYTTGSPTAVFEEEDDT